MLANSKKRVLSLFLAFVMVFGLLPTAAFAAANDGQIGKYVELNADDTIQAGTETATSTKTIQDPNGYVIMSKDITGTDKENEFLVTLKVETTEQESTMTAASGADVVLVFDVSTSMDYTTGGTAPGGRGWKLSNTRWTALKEAAESFITGLLANSKNRVSIVIYGGWNGWSGNPKVHKTICNWTSNAQTAINTFKNYDVVCQDYVYKDGVTNKTSLRKAYLNDDGTDYGATNCQAGFRGAWQALNARPNDASTQENSQYVIYMSDGEANEYYDGYGSESAAKSEAGVLKTKYPDSTLYTVGFGLGDNGNSVMSPSGKNGNKAVDRYYPADDADELEIVYNNINTAITLRSKAWEVTDPMGAMIEFGEIKTAVGTAVAREENGTLTWTIRKDTPGASYDKTMEGKKYTFHPYELQYTIRLKTESSGFAAGEFYPTNKQTKLTYVFSNAEGNIPEDAELKEAFFKVPTVKGYLGSLSFRKEDGRGTPVTGAQFTLNCTCGDPVHGAAASGTSLNGNVTISNIPSGHTYTMAETVPANSDFDQSKAETYTVTVDYGKVTVTDSKNTVVYSDAENKKDMTVINYYKPQDLPLNLTKTWVPEAPAGVTEITVTVDRITGYDQNDKPVFDGTGAYQHEIKVTKNGDTWTGSASLPTRDINDNTTITYGVVGETGASGYDLVSGTSMNLVNVSNGEDTIQLKKIWNTPDQTGEAVTLRVKGSDGSVKDVTLDGTVDSVETTAWAATLNLPSYDAEGKITYSVVELDRTGAEKSTGVVELANGAYTVSISGGTVTNTIQQDYYGTLSGTKVWKNPEGNYDDTVEISLIATVDGSEYTVAVDTIGEQDPATGSRDWGYSFSSLPKYAVDTAGNSVIAALVAEGVELEGQSITYKVTDGLTDYNVTDGTFEQNLTNQIKPAAGTLSVTKTWEDDGNSYDTRPVEDVTLVVTRSSNGETDPAFEKTVTFDPIYGLDETPEAVAVNTATYTFEETFDVYDADGKLYTYTVAEQGAVTENQVTTIAGKDGAEYGVTYPKQNVTLVDGAAELMALNTLDGDQVTITVSKTWKGPGTEAATGKATFQVKDGDTVVDSCELTGDDSHTFTLPKPAASYDVVEVAVEGYTTDKTVNDEKTAYSFTNTIGQSTFDITGTKAWTGVPEGENLPETVTVILNRNGEKIDEDVITAAEGWNYAFEGLDKYDLTTGKEYVYTVTDSVGGFTATDGVKSNGYQLTNAFVPDYWKTSFEVIKAWNDGGNADGDRPESIYVGLYAGDTFLKYAELTSDTWKHTFTDLPKYATDGKTPIQYTVKEGTVAGDVFTPAGASIELDGVT